MGIIYIYLTVLLQLDNKSRVLERKQRWRLACRSYQERYETKRVFLGVNDNMQKEDREWEKCQFS